MAKNVFSNLLQRIGIVKAETIPSANSAPRIGGLLNDILNSVPLDFDPAATYKPGEWVIWEGQLVQCFTQTLAGQSPLTFPAKWTKYTANDVAKIGTGNPDYPVTQLALINYLTARLSQLGGGGSVPLASEDIAGIVKKASDIMLAEGVDDSAYVTPKDIHDIFLKLFEQLGGGGGDLAQVTDLGNTTPDAIKTGGLVIDALPLTTTAAHVMVPAGETYKGLTGDVLKKMALGDLITLIKKDLGTTTPGSGSNDGLELTLIEVRCPNPGQEIPVITNPPVAPTYPDQSLTVNVPYSEQIARFSNDTGGTYTLEDAPAGLTLDQSDPGHLTIRGTPKTIAPDPKQAFIILTLGGVITTGHQYFFVLADSVKRGLEIVSPQYDCSTGKGVIQTQYGDGTGVVFSPIPGVRGAGTSPEFTIEAGIRNDPNSQPIVFQAVQSGISTAKYTFDFHARCAVGNDTTPPTQPVFTMPDAKVGVNYSFQLPVWGNAGTGAVYSVSGLPEGMSIDDSGRGVSGRPVTAGFPSFAYNINKAGAKYSMTVNLTINSADPVVSKASLRFYEGNLQGTPQSGGTWAAHLIKVATINQPAGTVPQVGVQLRGMGEIFPFNTSPLSGDSVYQYQESHGVVTFGNVDVTSLTYYARLNSAGTWVQLATRSVTNIPADKADKTVLYDKDSPAMGNDTLAAEGPADQSLAGSNYKGVAFVTNTPPSNLTA